MQKRLNGSRDTVWGLTHLGPRNHVLDGGQDRMNPFAAAKGDKMAMRHFCQITLSTCSFILLQYPVAILLSTDFIILTRWKVL